MYLGGAKLFRHFLQEHGLFPELNYTARFPPTLYLSWVALLSLTSPSSPCFCKRCLMIFQENEVKSMGRRKEEPTPLATKKRKAARTPDARENQLISLAYDLAEQRLLNGTASSAEVVQLMKWGSKLLNMHITLQ